MCVVLTLIWCCIDSHFVLCRLSFSSTPNCRLHYPHAHNSSSKQQYAQITQSLQSNQIYESKNTHSPCRATNIPHKRYTQSLQSNQMYDITNTHTSRMLWLYMGVGLSVSSDSPCCPTLRRLLRVGPRRTGLKALEGQQGTSRMRTGGCWGVLQVSTAHGRRGSLAQVVHSTAVTCVDQHVDQDDDQDDDHHRMY